MARGGKRPGAGRPRKSSLSTRPNFSRPGGNWQSDTFTRRRGDRPAEVARLMPGAVPVSKMADTTTRGAAAADPATHRHVGDYGSGYRRRATGARTAHTGTARVDLTRVRARTARHPTDPLWAFESPADEPVSRRPAPDTGPLAEPDPATPKRGRPGKADPLRSDPLDD